MRLGKVRLATIGFVLAVVVIALVAWFVVLSPRLATASDLQDQAEQMQTANLALRNQYNKALDLAEQAPAAAAEAQDLFARMPQTAELPAVLEQITGAATDAGINPLDVSSITTGIPVPVTASGKQTTSASGTQNAGVQLAKMDITVAAEGERRQVLTFLDNLQGLDRALLVTSTIDTAVTPTEAQTSTTRESMQVGGSMFVLQSKLPDLVAEVEKLIAEAQAQQSTPAEPAS